MTTISSAQAEPVEAPFVSQPGLRQAQAEREGGQGQPLALYVHWPFCVSRCPYCDFNAHVRADVDQDAWCAALLTDLAWERGRSGPGRLRSIFFGGGTPSLMPPATVAALIDAARDHWDADAELEITLEANPSSVEAARFADLSAAGVNRVSLGLQALDDPTLRFLGRAHDLAEGLAALDRAQASFGRVSFDLITARPGQTVAGWEAELDRALAFGTEHLSLYQLTIEPGTRFATELREGRLTELDEDTAADLWEATQAMTAAAGLPAYEVSNHARDGAASRHNLAYWTGAEYLGVGPGAHGRRGGLATERHRKPENWLAAVGRNGHGLKEERRLAPGERATEAVLTGLRLAAGIDMDRVVDDTRLADLLDRHAIRQLADQGMIVSDGPRLRVTNAGMPVLNAVLAKLVR